MYKVIVAHPGKQHSFQTAIALMEKGMLYQYITTVYNNPRSLLMRAVKKVVRQSNLQRAEGRKSEQLDGCVTQFCEIYGLLLLLILRLDKSSNRILYTQFNQFVSRRFGRKVAQYAIKHNVDAVICYDTASTECFRLLRQKAPQILRILDNAAPNRYGLYKEYQRLNKENHIFAKQRETFKDYLLEEYKAMPFQEEAALATNHLVASSFSKRMLLNAGVPESQITVLPYGFEARQHEIKQYDSDRDIVRFLFVGEISPQKGIYDYIAVAKEFSGKAEFHAAGGGIERLQDQDQADFRKNIVYHGFLTKNQLFDLYQQCDVLIFPSLGDGFGFVVLEALSFGLPVICSKNSVGEDIIMDGFNGFLFDAGDSEALKRTVNIQLHNKQQLANMRHNAVQSVSGYTWDHYGSLLAEMIECSKHNI